MSKTPIPCIVGVGGVTPAGRASHNLSHTRVTYSLESDQNKKDYIKSVLSLSVGIILSPNISCNSFNLSFDLSIT